MSLLGEFLRQLSGVLQADWALVGGLAVSARAEPRLTRDIDVAIAVDSDSAAEAIVADLIALGYQSVSTVEQDRTGRLATVRLRPPGQSAGGVVVDLLFASSGIEPEVVAAAEVIEVLDGIEVRVAQPGHLFAMKVLSRDDDTRPQDRLDLAALGAVMFESDRKAAERAIELITQRGFDRQRDLRANLADAFTRFVPR